MSKKHKIKEVENVYIGLYFENNNWYIIISENKEKAIVSTHLKSFIIRLFDHYDSLEITDKDYKLLIKPFDSIYHSIFDCFDVMLGFCTYSGKLSNIINSDKVKVLFKHLYECKIEILSGEYPVIKSFNENDIDNILDKINKEGINNLTILEKKVLEVNSQI